MKHILRKAACAFLAAAMALCLLCACGKQKEIAPVQTEGAVGTALSTLFFDVTANTAQRVEKYGDFLPEKDTALILVNVTVKNTTDAALTMFDSDFTLAYGADGKTTAWVYDAFAETMLPAEDTLNVGDSRSYDLLFPVPAAEAAFALCYTESYKDDAGTQTTGNTFRIEFTA